MKMVWLFIGSMGTTELIILLAIVLVIFGARKLPELGSGLGHGIQNFKKALRGDSEDDSEQLPDGDSANAETNSTESQKTAARNHAG